MKKTMKKLIFVLLFCVLSSFCFSQSFDYVEEVVNSKEVSFLQVATLVSQDLSLVSDGNYYPQYATDRKIVNDNGLKIGIYKNEEGIEYPSPILLKKQ